MSYFLHKSVLVMMRTTRFSKPPVIPKLHESEAENWITISSNKGSDDAKGFSFHDGLSKRPDANGPRQDPTSPATLDSQRVGDINPSHSESASGTESSDGLLTRDSTAPSSPSLDHLRFTPIRFIAPSTSESSMSHPAASAQQDLIGKSDNEGTSCPGQGPSADSLCRAWKYEDWELVEQEMQIKHCQITHGKFEMPNVGEYSQEEGCEVLEYVKRCLKNDIGVDDCHDVRMDERERKLAKANTTQELRKIISDNPSPTRSQKDLEQGCAKLKAIIMSETGTVVDFIELLNNAKSSYGHSITEKNRRVDHKFYIECLRQIVPLDFLEDIGVIRAQVEDTDATKKRGKGQKSKKPDRTAILEGSVVWHIISMQAYMELKSRLFQAEKQLRQCSCRNQPLASTGLLAGQGYQLPGIESILNPNASGSAPPGSRVWYQ